MANTDQETAAYAWDQATKGITGADDILAAAKPKFVEGIGAGRAMPDLEDEIIDGLAGRDWTWPWFEECYAQFGEWRMWPNTWPQLRPDDDGTEYTDEDLAEYRKSVVASLIIDTAAMIFFRDRHMGKSHAHQKWRLAYTGDAASMRAAEAHRDKIKDGDISRMPPFYPGDKTRMQADNPLKPEGDARPAENGTPTENAAGGAKLSLEAAVPKKTAAKKAPAKKGAAKKGTPKS